MKRVIALTLLLLAGCMIQTPPQGNAPTYSGNGKGEQDAAIIRECAWLAYDLYKKDPSINADAVFVLCLDENGVWAI